MGLETGTYIDSLNSANPVGSTDPKSQGDDHIRLIKSTILATLPGLTGAMTLTQTQLNDAAIKAEANIFTAQQRIASVVPSLFLEETDATADEGKWNIVAASDGLFFQAFNDAEAAASSFVIVQRTGTVVDSIELDCVTLILDANVRILDAGGTDYVDISHNGTDLILAATNTAWFRFRDMTGGVIIEDGTEVRIYDSTNTDYLSLSHGGTNFELAFTTTTNVNVSGLGGVFWIRDGAGLRISDAADTDYCTFDHNGTNFRATFVQTAQFALLGGVDFRVYDASNTDYISLAHNGTDATLATGGAAILNLSGPTTLNTGTVLLGTTNNSAQELGFKGTPQRSISDSDTLALTDCGKQIYLAAGASKTLTIPANASVAFPIGTIIPVINDSGNDWTIAITTDTLEEYGGTTGSKTLPDNAKAILEKVTATLWKYSASY